MKLYFLNSGRVEMKKKIFIPDLKTDEKFQLPVISTYINYKKTNILFDTGCHPSVETNAEKRWGGLSKIMTPINMNGKNLITELSAIGIFPDDIDIVINSHLHPDHCGCNEFFKNAEFYCHTKEFQSANETNASQMGYIKSEWNLPMPLKQIKKSYDVFDDSRIVTINLPGHTPGSIGLLVNLDHNRFLIASDALSLERNLDREEIPKNSWNPNLLLKSYQELMKIKKSGFTIVCGHDDTQWKNKLKMGINYN